MSILNITGRLGRDAELRYTPNGTAVCNLAVAYHYGQKQGDGYRSTQWIDAVLWGDQAQRLLEYLLTGTVLTLSLRDTHIEEFTRRDGTPGSRLTGTIMHLEFTPAQKPRDDAAPASSPRQPPAKPKPKPEAQVDPVPFDDDIPF